MEIDGNTAEDGPSANREERGLRRSTKETGQNDTNMRLVSSAAFTFAALSLLACNFDVLGSEFTAEGNVKYEIFTPTGALMVHQEDAFRISVQGCNWFIEQRCWTNWISGKAQLPSFPVIHSSDSTNFYRLSDYKAITNEFPGTRAWAGLIGSGSVPYGVDPTALILWYGFASSCYLQTANEHYLAPPKPMGRSENYVGDFRVLADWRVNDSAPHLPNYLAFDSTPRSGANVVPRSKSAWHFGACQ